jgi:predicted nucleotidyltransferase
MKFNAPFLDEIISIIRESADPDQIILFGSYARGDYTPHSDIDLLIIKKGLKNARTLTGPLHLEFFKHRIGIPVDVLAIDSNKYRELQSDVGYIYKTIAQEGKVIYGKL